MDLGLKDKGVLVLASSDGIGKGVATEFAKAGARVMLFSRNEDRLKSTAQEIAELAESAPPNYLVGDVANPEDIENAVNQTVKQCGGIWALFNNTGGPPAGSFEQFDDAAWQAAFELTMMGYVRSIRAAIPHMRKAGGGRIVNNTSASTKQSIDSLILSNTFRAGLVGLGKTLARELGPDHILVNTVGPGRIDTPRVEQLDNIWADQKGISYQEQRDQSEASIPLGSYGLPSDFGKVVTFLSSQANQYVTGQNLLIDGAMVEAY